MTIVNELNRLAAKADAMSAVCFGKGARVIESSERAFLAKAQGEFTLVYLKSGRVEFDVFRDKEAALSKMLIVA